MGCVCVWGGETRTSLNHAFLSGQSNPTPERNAGKWPTSCLCSQDNGRSLICLMCRAYGDETCMQRSQNPASPSCTGSCLEWREGGEGAQAYFPPKFEGREGRRLPCPAHYFTIQRLASPTVAGIKNGPLRSLWMRQQTKGSIRTH